MPWLWRLHAIHHSSRRLYWLNGQRRHVLHELCEGLRGRLVLGALGASVAVVGCALGAITVHLVLQHGNVAYRAAALRFVFAVAKLHRWHHQRLYTNGQGNYGALFAVWDYGFGTALPKTGEAPVDVGGGRRARAADEFPRAAGVAVPNTRGGRRRSGPPLPDRPACAVLRNGSRHPCRGDSERRARP